MGLSDLPTEVLHHIADFLFDLHEIKSCQVLCCLAAVNHSLHDVIGGRLFQYAMLYFKTEYLHWAARRDYLDYVQRALNSTLGQEVPYCSRARALIYAAREGSNDVVNFFLDTYPNLVDYDSTTDGHAICDAVKKGHMSTLELILEKKPRLYRQDPRDEPPLCVAARLGRVEMVERLIRAGADVNNSHRSMNPVRSAVVHGHSDVVTLLLEHGATAGLHPGPNVQAVGLLTTEDLEILRLLLTYGATVDAWCTWGGWRGTPLMYASKMCRLDAARILIEFGADASLRNRVGQSMITILIGQIVFETRFREEGQMRTRRAGPALELIDLLLENGTMPNDVWTCSQALHLAVANHLTEFIRPLIARNAKPDGLINGGRYMLNTPPTLWWAVTRNDHELVDLLLESGADPNARLIWPNCNPDGPRTLLEVVCRRGYDDMAVLLLDRGATPTNKVLLSVVKANNVRLAEKMILRGAKPTGEELFYAVARGSNDMVSLLMTNGSDPNVQTPVPTGKRGKGPETRKTMSVMEYAIKRGNVGIISSLREHGAKPPGKSFARSLLRPFCS